jgi:hypothetical protein
VILENTCKQGEVFIVDAAVVRQEGMSFCLYPFFFRETVLLSGGGVNHVKSKLVLLILKIIILRLLVVE